MSTPLRERPDAPLGTLIFRAGLLPAETIESALEEGVRTGKRLGEVLSDRGLLDDADLARLLAGQKGLDFVVLRDQVVDPSAAALFTGEQARLFHALPYAFDGGRPVVAIADPNDEILTRNIRETIGRPDVIYAVCTRSELAEALDAVYAGAREPAPAAAPAPSSPPEPGPLSVPAPADPDDRADGAELSAVAPFPPTPAPAPVPAAAPAPELRLPEPPRPEPAAEAPAPGADEPPLPPIQAAPAPEPPRPAPEPPAPVLPPAAELPAPAPPPPVLPPAAEPPAAEPPAPEPAAPILPLAAEEPEEPAPSSSTDASYRVGIRLTTGERVEAGVFADLAAAKQHAKSLMHQVGGAGEDDWPYVSGRFLKPDTIVSVDIAGPEPTA